MDKDATVPTLVDEPPAPPKHEFDRLQQSDGPAGWFHFSFWSRSAEGATVPDKLRALADKLEAL